MLETLSSTMNDQRRMVGLRPHVSSKLYWALGSASPFGAPSTTMLSRRRGC